MLRSVQISVRNMQTVYDQLDGDEFKIYCWELLAQMRERHYPLAAWRGG